MAVHRPNHVPKRTRILLLLAIAVIGLYAAAHLVTGYVYVPAKRGGILLSGASTLMIVLAQLFIALGCAAKIVDHYDTRPNEHAYQAFRRFCFKAALPLFLLAPLAQIAIVLLNASGVHVPDFHGLSSGSTFYSPSLKAYESVLSLDRAMLLPLGLTAAALLFIGWLAVKFEIDSTMRVPMLLVGAGLVLVSVLCMNMFMHDFLVGETELKRMGHRTIVSALSDPAKFNAVLLTKFSVVGLVLTFSFLAVLSGVVGSSSRHALQRFWRSFRDQ